MPPRHGKSEFVSKYFPGWWLGNFPDEKVILGSYEADFASQWGGAVRDTLEEYGDEVFGVRLRHDSKAKNRWNVVGRRGGMQTAGTNGAVTGKGAHLLIIDDPVKNWQEASSETYRASSEAWFKTVAYTRLEPRGVIVLVMTRWFQDDMAGNRLARMADGSGEPWTVIDFPAIAEEQDVLGRKPGDALWPERFTAQDLDGIKRELGPYHFAALYQQKPQPAEGGLFKREKFQYCRLGKIGDAEYFTAPGREPVALNSCICFQTVDLAASLKETADYFVLGTWYLSPLKDLYLRDVVRLRVEGPDQVPLIVQKQQQFGAKYVAIEKSGFQLTTVQAAVRTGLPARGVTPQGDKWGHALGYAARVDQGTVFFLEGAPWLGAYETELVNFGPGCAHDDQVDMSSYAAEQLNSTLSWTSMKTTLPGRRKVPI